MATIQRMADLYRGSTRTQSITFTGYGDITGSAIVMTARDADGGVVFSRANVTGGGDASQAAIISGSAGTAEIYLIAANTTGLLLRPGELVELDYDITITLGSGAVDVAFSGKLPVVGNAGG